jgi:hypothetical protein
MVEITEVELTQANPCGEAERAKRPTPSSVRFDEPSERFIVDFVDGASFTWPARSLQGLEHATAQQLAEMELLGETGLHWEERDVDLKGLMNGIFGTKAFMELQRA